MRADSLLRNMVALFHLLPKIEEDLIKYAYLRLNQILHKKLELKLLPKLVYLLNKINNL